MRIDNNKIRERILRYVFMAFAAVTLGLVSASCGSDGDGGYDDDVDDSGGGSSSEYQQAMNMISQFWMGNDTHDRSVWLTFRKDGTVSERTSTNLAYNVYKTEGTWEFCSPSYDQVRFSSNMKVSEYYGSVHNISFSDNGKTMRLFCNGETLTFSRVGDSSGGGGSSGDDSSSDIDYIPVNVLEVYVQQSPYSQDPIVETSTHSWYKSTVNGNVRLYESTRSPYDYHTASRNPDSYQEGVSVGSYRYRAIERGSMSWAWYYYYFN